MDHITIVSTANSLFSGPLLALYRSILSCNPDENFIFYVFDDDLSGADRLTLKGLTGEYSNCQQVDFLNIDDTFFQHVVTDDRIPASAYYRIYTAELLPEVNRVLYLDCDLICTGDIRAMWATELDNNLIGAIEDAGYVSRLDEMDIEVNSHLYFNSGVMLIDLQRWREENITDKVMEFINQYPEKLKYHDQDALNAVLADRWKYLHPKYNMQSRLIRREQQHPVPALEVWAEEARQNPVLIHYSGRSKPWIESGVRPHPLKKAYFKYASKMVEIADRTTS